MSRLPFLIACFAAAILPAEMGDWGRGMVAETEAIGRAGPGLRFAVGCLWAAVSHRLSLHFTKQDPMMHDRPTEHPRRFASYCAAGAVGLGLSYMAVAGAPAF